MTDQGMIDKFLNSLHHEIELYSEFKSKEKIETIYVGGGTPSLLSPHQLGEIFEHLHKSFQVLPNIEITMEVNPGTINREKLIGYRKVGVNRLSIGVQSFHDEELQFLTRIHSSAESIRSILLTQECGFENISIDLIYALPHQSLSRWEQTLKKAIAFEPQHVSAYSLIVEEGTPLESMVSTKQISSLSIEQEASMYELAMDILQNSGYEHYEVSNYARPGFRSKHNSNYWNHSNYLGFGPSAHSFWINKRWWNDKDLVSYCHRLSMNELPIAGEENLTAGQLLDEAVMLGLRTGRLHFMKIKLIYGVDILAKVGLIIKELLANKLAIMEEDTLILNDRGFLVCDSISSRMLADL